MRYVNTILLAIVIIISTASAAPLPDGLHDDTYPALDYSGTWSDAILSDAYGGGYQETTDSAAILSIEIYAEGFVLFFIYDPSGGNMSICIDDDCSTVVSTVGASGVGRAEISGLATGLKTIEIRKTDPDTSPVGFDAIYIYPTPPAAIVEEVHSTISNEYTLDGESYRGSIVVSVDVGQIMTVLLLAVLVLISLTQIIVRQFE